MDAAQGSAWPVEPAQSVEAPMELRMYLLRFDGEGSAVELARLRPCSHQVDAPLRALAPVVVNEAAEIGRREAAVYLAVLEGGEVKRLARLSSFLEGLSGGSSTDDAEEAQQNVDTHPTATSSSDQDQNQCDLFGTLSLEEEEEEEKEVDTSSQEEKKEMDTSSQEEKKEMDTSSQEEEEGVVGTFSWSSSSSSEEEKDEDEDEVDTSSQEEEEGVVGTISWSSSSSEERSSVKIRMCPGLSRLVLVLFDGGNWKLTRVQHLNWLQKSDAAEVLKLTGLRTEKCQNDNPCPKFFSHWSQDTVSWLEFEGTLLNEKLMCAQFNATMGDFKVLRFLGKGATGKVYQCVYRNDPIHEVQYALKKMDVSDDFDDIETICGEEPREVNIMSCLEDDLVVSFYQAWVADGEYKSYLSPNDEEDDEEDDDEEDTMRDGLLEPRYVVIQMELCQRTLMDDLPYKDREINIDDSWKVFEEITKGLQYMHRMGIVHRDLKPDNIFIGINGRIKIGDMGHACWVKDDGLIGTPNRGTHVYKAPELDTEHITIKADIYSIGVIFLELFYPFSTKHEKIKALEGFRNNTQPDGWKGDTKLLMQLMALRPSDRPSTEEILDYIAQRHKNIGSQ